MMFLCIKTIHSLWYMARPWWLPSMLGYFWEFLDPNTLTFNTMQASYFLQSPGFRWLIHLTIFTSVGLFRLWRSCLSTPGWRWQTLSGTHSGWMTTMTSIWKKCWITIFGKHLCPSSTWITHCIYVKWMDNHTSIFFTLYFLDV